MTSPLRLVFAGSPQFSVELLQAVLDQGHQIEAVLTQPDRPAGRGKRLQASAVKQSAQAARLPVYDPVSLKNARPDELSERPDFLLVVAYGVLLPKRWLVWPRLAALNIHTSLLPRWRGAAPIERAIMAGDKETGVCIMSMETGLDTGPIFASDTCPIAPDDNLESLTGKLSKLASTLLAGFFAQYTKTGILSKAQPQASEGITYASKITPADALIDWSTEAASIDRQIRALSGRFGGSTLIDYKERLSIEQACVEISPDSGAKPGTIHTVDKTGITIQCGTGMLKLLKMRLPDRGKGSVLGAQDILNGFGSLLKPGLVLGSAESLAV